MIAAGEISTRGAERFDIPRLVEIERESFPSPWDGDDFKATMLAPKGAGIVAQQGGLVVGYAVFEASAEHIELLNLAVEACSRRKGIGRRLVGELVLRIERSRRKTMQAIVRETNLPALNLLKAGGFAAEQLYQRFYPETREDAIAMVYRRGGAAAKRRFFWKR